MVEELPGVLDSMVERHEEAALIGTVGTAVLGLLGLVGWWWSRAERRLVRWYPATVLVVGVLVAGYMGWVANLGGQIRHSEIRPGQAAAAGAEAERLRGRQAPGEQGEDDD